MASRVYLCKKDMTSAFEREKNKENNTRCSAATLLMSTAQLVHFIIMINIQNITSRLCKIDCV